MRSRHRLALWTTWHWHRWLLETLWSTLLKLWLSAAGHSRHATHRHLEVSSLRWALIVGLPLLLHIRSLRLLLIWVSLVIASTHVVVIILVLPILVVRVWIAVTLPWLLIHLWLHHGVEGPVSTTHLWSSIHHLLRLWHWHLVGGPEALVNVHRGSLSWCSRGFELL